MPDNSTIFILYRTLIYNAIITVDLLGKYF